MSANKQRRKYEVFQKSRMWYIAITCLVSLPCVFSRCQRIMDIGVAIYPEGSLHLQYGKPLEIFCVAETGTADDLTFYTAVKTLPSETLNTTTRRLFVKDLEIGAYRFDCLNSVTSKSCFSTVLVGQAPSNVIDFNCMSKNLEELKCTWTSKINISLKHFDFLTLSTSGPISNYPCKPEMQARLLSCVWNSTTHPPYRHLEDNLQFQLETCNGFGCNVQKFRINHYSIIKPEAPRQLKVLSTYAHSVLLQWKIPEFMYRLRTCGVTHKVEYQIVKSGTRANFWSVDASSLQSKNATYTLLLSNLPYAHTMYEVRIYIKPAKATEDKFWSDFAFIVFQTASEKPQRPPETAAGAFSDDINGNERLVVVYWKQLEQHEEAADNFTYKVVVNQGSNYSRTLHTSESYVRLDNAPLEDFNLHIWSVNAVGNSTNSSYLYIPCFEEIPALTVHQFSKFTYKNGTNFLSWNGDSHVDNYTLLWCQHKSLLCVSSINFTVLNPNQNSFVVDLPNDEYIFSIAANSGSETIGLIIPSCQILEANLENRELDVYHVVGQSFIHIIWSIPCTLPREYLTGYFIRLTDCSESWRTRKCLENTSSYKISDPKQMEIKITGLKPWSSYEYQLALNTTPSGLISLKPTSFFTLRLTPHSPRNVIISDVQSNSLVISWDFTLFNIDGLPDKFIISYNEGEISLDFDFFNNPFFGRYNSTLTNLQVFTNYSISVRACNKHSSCSDPSPSQGIFVRTRIGPPSKTTAPNIENNPDSLHWEAPKSAGGYIDHYEVKRMIGDSPPKIYNTTDTHLHLKFCDGTHSTEKYQIRAVNFDEDAHHGVLGDKLVVELPERQSKEVLEYPGEWSDKSSLSCQFISPPAIAYRLKIDVLDLKPNKKNKFKLSFKGNS